MIPVNITLQFMRDGLKSSAGMRLSMDMTAEEAIRGIVIYLSLPDDGAYRLLRQRQLIDPTSRLFEAGVQEGDILQLTAMDANTTIGGVGRSMSAGILSRLGGKGGAAPLPLSAALLTTDGQIFMLRHTRALIGRADEKLGYPAEMFDVELSAFDPNRSVSRPHAVIVYGEDGFSIRDLHSQVGVDVNGERITLSKAQPIHDGDVITIGDIVLQFRCEH